MPLRKAPAADLRRQRPLHVLVGLALALAVVIAAFTVPVRASTEAGGFVESDAPVELEVVPPTTQRTPPPPPPAPPPPVEVDDEVTTEDIVDELAFDPMEDIAPAPGPPPAPEPRPTPKVAPPPPTTPPTEEHYEPEDFVFAEVQPELIGGVAGLQARVRYPERAMRAGVEGRVVVQFVVDERGAVIDPVVVVSPNALLSEAAIEAVRASTFTPGQQRGRPVRVRIAVPVTFRLK